MTGSDRKTIEIDVVSDVMCPWCFIGKKNLEAATGALDGIDVTINWRPFQLDPTLPAEGKDRKQYLEEKFGGENGARQAYTRVEEAGRAAGIDFHFNDIAVSPNTLDAHRLIRWAGGVSLETQQRVVNRLFELYFIEGANIGDAETLVALGTEAGLDAATVRTALDSTELDAAIDADIHEGTAIGVRGVPFFVVNDTYGVSGAQSPDVFREVLERAFADQKSTLVDVGGEGEACGPDGC